MRRTSLSRFPLRTLACAAMASAVLSGCINLAPTYETPASPVPEALPSTGVTAATPLDVSWRDFFVDKQLQGVIELALANNRDLRVAALNIERARAQYGIARAGLFPTVEGGAGGSRSRTPGSLSTSGEARISSQYSADLGMTAYELDLFGRVRNLSESALQSYFQTEETRRSTQISLVASVATAWLQLAADEQRLALARSTLESQRKSYDLIQRSHALGSQSGLALAQSQSTVDAARADAAAFDSLVEQDRNALTLLVGTTPPAELLPTTATAEAAQLLVPPAGLSSSVLQQRPDVRAAEHALRASNADIGAARAAFFPRIALTASAGTASSTLSGLFTSGSKAWSFAPSVSVPIFDGGANRSNLKVAEAQQKIQLATYEKTVQTAFREVADALAERRTLAERLDAQRSLLGATSRSFELSQSLFRSGATSFLDVLDAQRAHYAAQQTLIGLQLTEQTNRLTIYRTLGGGWSEGGDGNG
ncbi:multidrug efflux system outer membrane protein [Variovorax boronicumulans]|uniref:efflux transporter outer membrane subunit n=1 Tax=Variovorax TaxID=34072 RepID=UPI00277E45CE|nr:MULTISPECIES: efflux transporter outer membrane subunit [Variovorax]MDQ0037964.1 multidrug efflux system outer membrane protein [Variovorax boronicumulans]MDQ0041679.1 multidrug efflux system outer membrane protein [Variovorax boronicumulans]MDQ0610039.1 multidrug efflux system outer membrane protein [Variovorax sp. W1I1]